MKPVRIAALLVVLTFIMGGLAYSQLPVQMASHWNIEGEVDGYMSRFWGVFILPLIIAATYVGMVILPRLDPKHHNLVKFKPYYDRFLLVLIGFLTYVYGLTLAYNLGAPLNLVRWLMPGLSVLFFALGSWLSYAEPNWTFGLRTPWTLSNPDVWRQTHTLGAKVYRVGALLPLLGFWRPEAAFWLLMIGILGGSLFLYGYSFYLYRSLALKTSKSS